MPPRRRDTPEAKVKIGGKPYYLDKRGAEPIYSTGTRVIEGKESDYWELPMEDFSEGFGSDLGYSTLLTSQKGQVMPAPAVTNIDVSAVGTVDKPPRFAMELQDTNGDWYLFVFSENQVIKIDLTNSEGTVRKVYDVASAPWPQAGGAGDTDKIGQPVVGVHSGTRYLYIPVNNGDRIVRMVLPCTVNDGVTTTNDTFTTTLATTIDQGGAHFVQLASGGIVRVNSTHSTGTFQNRCEVSYLEDAGNFETDANWSDDHPVGNQGDWAIAAMAFEDSTLVRKSNDHWYVATRLESGQVKFRDILPDEVSSEQQSIGAETSNTGKVWHGKLYLPTASSLWRHTLASAIPVGMESIKDSLLYDVGRPSFRNASPGAVVPAGEYLYGLFNQPRNPAAVPSVATVTLIAAGREGRGRSGGEIQWASVKGVSSYGPDQTNQFLYLARNWGSIIRPIMVYSSLVDGGSDWDLHYFEIGAHGTPYTGAGTYGTSGDLDRFVTRSFLFPCQALLVGVRMVIEDAGNATVNWEPYSLMDGGSYVAIGSGTQTTGTSFVTTPGTNDTFRRVIFRCDADVDSAGHATPPHLRRFTPFGYYLPAVDDPVKMVVNIKKTAERRKMSQAAVRAELKGYRNARQAFVDIHNASGHILITEANQTAPEILAGRDEGELMTVNGIVVSYS